MRQTKQFFSFMIAITKAIVLKFEPAVVSAKRSCAGDQWARLDVQGQDWLALLPLKNFKVMFPFTLEVDGEPFAKMVAIHCNDQYYGWLEDYDRTVKALDLLKKQCKTLAKKLEDKEGLFMEAYGMYLREDIVERERKYRESIVEKPKATPREAPKTEVKAPSQPKGETEEDFEN